MMARVAEGERAEFFAAVDEACKNVIVHAYHGVEGEDDMVLSVFESPDGIAVPDVGYVSRLGENPPAGGLLSVVESTVKEPPPPQYLH